MLAVVGCSSDILKATSSNSITKRGIIKKLYNRSITIIAIQTIKHRNREYQEIFATECLLWEAYF